MSITTTTHLNFRGTARGALEFYASVFGGDAVITTYGDLGMPAEAPGAHSVVFGAVDNGSEFRVLAYDIPGLDDTDTTLTAGATRREHGTTITDRTFFLALQADTLDELTGYWNALMSGGTVIEPLAASAWSPGFGMLTDRFGVTWSLDVRVTYAG
jgi:PhnB protein